MKIAVVALTRENPAGIITAIHGLRSLASGDHQITFFIRADEDDPTVFGQLVPAMRGHQDWQLILGPRPVCLGDAWNSAKPEGEFDALTVICDDMVPLTQNWDRGIDIMFRERGFDLFAWTEVNDPMNVTYPVFSRKWIDAYGKIFPGGFPFWFDDTWISQVYEIAKGEPVAIVRDMQLGGRRGRTSSMRDLAFWVEFFRVTLPIRAIEAAAVREKLGWPERNVDLSLQKLNRLNSSYDVLAIEEVRRDLNQGPPSDRYLLALERAKQFSAENLDHLLPSKVFGIVKKEAADAAA